MSRFLQHYCAPIIRDERFFAQPLDFFFAMRGIFPEVVLLQIGLWAVLERLTKQLSALDLA